MELCWNWVKTGLCHFLVRYFSISLFFFAKCDLIRLRNTPMKFCDAALGRYGAMLELGVNGVISFSGVFLGGQVLDIIHKGYCREPALTVPGSRARP
jgi:hypothetical protein